MKIGKLLKSQKLEKFKMVDVFKNKMRNNMVI